MTRFRRAGARWRLLVHNMLPTRRNVDRIAATYGVTTVVPDTEFDELVVGQWMHVEQMGDGRYWMSIAGLHVNVVADRDGRAR